MNDPKHTPGSWIQSLEGNDYGQFKIQISPILPNGEQGLAIAYAWGLRRPEVEANASLIAAAPDMLKALRTARDVIWAAKCFPPDHPMVAEIEAAIDKATGDNR